MTKRYLTFLTAMCALMLATACQDRRTPADHRPVITVSIEPLRYFVEQIAGDRYRVATLVPSGSSPETYEPTPAQLVELSNSRAYLRMGTLPFEVTWLQRLVETAPTLPVADVAKGVAFITDTHGHEVDLHVWTSPQNAEVVARNVAAFLSQTDTAGRDYYNTRLEAFVAKTDSLDARLRTMLSDLSQRTFVIYHPALGYFAKSYGLVQLSIEDHGREPGAGQMASLVSRSRQAGVKVIFMQKEYRPDNAQTLARETGARIVEINPLGYDWEGEMIRIAQALAQ